MKPIATLTEDGDLKIDLAHLMDYDSGASEALYRKLTRWSLFEEEFIGSLLDHLATGATEDGDWWSSEFAERLRARLLPLIDDVIAQHISDLVHDRDHCKAMSDRWRNACWQIADQWDAMDRERCRKAREPDYHVERTMTAKEAKAWMVKMREEIDGPA